MNRLLLALLYFPSFLVLAQNGVISESDVIFPELTTDISAITGIWETVLVERSYISYYQLDVKSSDDITLIETVNGRDILRATQGKLTTSETTASITFPKNTDDYASLTRRDRKVLQGFFLGTEDPISDEMVAHEFQAKFIEYEGGSARDLIFIRKESDDNILGRIADSQRLIDCNFDANCVVEVRGGI